MSFYTRRFLLLGLSCFFLAAPASASENWTKLKSDSGVYTVDVPKDYTLKSNTFRISPHSVAYNELLEAEIDQRPIKNAVNRYIVTLDNTIGPPLSSQQVDLVLKNATENFIHHYRQKDALLLKQTPGDTFGGKTNNIEMVYNDEELGPQIVKAVIGAGATFRLHQILIGPEAIMDSKLTGDYFRSLTTKDGLAYQPVELRDAWEKHISPLETFSYYTPQVAAPYMREEPQITFSDKTEKITVTVFDPIRLETLTYNVYGYKTDEKLTYQKAELFLFNKHVAKYLETVKDARVKRVVGSKYPTLQLDFPAPKKPGDRQKNVIRLKASFAQDYIMIQEIVSTKALAYSDISTNLFWLTDFQPEEAHKLFMRKKAVADHLDQIIPEEAPEGVEE